MLLFTSEGKLRSSFVSHMKGCIKTWHGSDLSNFLLKWHQHSDPQGKRDFCNGYVSWLRWEHCANSWTGPIDPLVGVETYKSLPKSAFMEGGIYLAIWEDFITQIQKLHTPLTKKDLEKFL